MYQGQPVGYRPPPTERSVFERALEIVKNFVVIITCVVILYVVITVYMALNDLSNQLNDVGKYFGG